MHKFNVATILIAIAIAITTSIATSNIISRMFDVSCDQCFDSLYRLHVR